MKNLLYKELKLVIHPALYLFILLSTILLIPNYPYFTGMAYCIVAFNAMFNVTLSAKDHEFTASLPVKRNDIVKAKMLAVMFFEFCYLVISVPFALLSCYVLNKSGNLVGLDANLTLFAEAILGYGVFNLLFFARYFKTGYKHGFAMLFGVIGFLVVVAAIEIPVNAVAALKSIFDGTAAEWIWARLLALAVAFAAYIGLTFATYRISVKNFDKVSL